MITCPNCQNQEPPGAIFCSECGMQLIQFDGKKTKQIDIVPGNVSTGPIKETAAPVKSNVTWISLHLLESGQIIPISDRLEFTLGRTSENQPIMPDIDLSASKAYEYGVSRLHAAVRLINGMIILMDLGSANGTYLNGTRLTPNIEHPIKHGDIISLGKLKIQIVLS